MEQKKKLTLLQTVQHLNSDLTERFPPNVRRSLKVTGASWAANILLGLGKLAMGILSVSFFLCVNAFYTFGMVIAKYFALKGILKAKDTREQYRYYTMSGAVLTGSSLVYIAYSVRLFFSPAADVYHMYIALAIAAFTFTELTVNIRGVILERRNHTSLVHAIKMINLASSLICLALTQTAILSFADTRVHLHPAANGLIGILTGSCAALLGVAMLVRIRRIQNGKHYGSAYRRVKKLMKKEHLSFSIKPALYEENKSGNSVLYLSFPEGCSKTEFACLQSRVKQNLKIQLINADTENKSRRNEK